MIGMIFSDPYFKKTATSADKSDILYKYTDMEISGWRKKE